MSAYYSAGIVGASAPMCSIEYQFFCFIYSIVILGGEMRLCNSLLDIYIVVSLEQFT